MKEDPIKEEGRKDTRRRRQIDKRGEERDLEWEAPPAKGKLPPSPTRRVEPACLLAIFMIPESSTYSNLPTINNEFHQKTNQINA